MSRDREGVLAVVFTGVLVVMVAHEVEHVAQILQKDALDATCPNDCRGLLGFTFDLEWVHVAYNHTLLLALVGMYLAFGLWRAQWRRRSLAAWGLLTAGVFVIQGYHVVEHSVKLEQWLENGHRSPTPGILGAHLSLVELHFVMNTAVLLLVAPAFFAFGLHRKLWTLRTPPRVAAAAGLLAALALGGGWLWTKRPPTIHLDAGVHRGPLVLDHAMRLEGEAGTVVRGGIEITADDVVVRDLAVFGGETGIAVEDAERVVLERIRVAGPVLDGINVRLASVTIRDCRIGPLAGRYAQGIDISFSIHRPPSTVSGCTVVGGQEGIVTHSAHVRLRNNRVSGTHMRGIAVTEMSMGSVEANHVSNAVGVGIFCGDYSHCAIEQNRVAPVRPDLASGDRMRHGFGIVAHFGAVATVHANAAPRVRAFAQAHIERRAAD